MIRNNAADNDERVDLLEQVLDEAHHLVTGALDLLEVAALAVGEIAALAEREESEELERIR